MCGMFVMKHRWSVWGWEGSGTGLGPKAERVITDMQSMINFVWEEEVRKTVQLDITGLEFVLNEIHVL